MASPLPKNHLESGPAVCKTVAMPQRITLIVLQIKTTADAKAVTAKFNLKMSNCQECKLTECTCACDRAAEDKNHVH